MFYNLEKLSLLLAVLEIGDSILFHISCLKSVPTQASELGAILTVSLIPKTDRENKAITVKRIV